MGINFKKITTPIFSIYQGVGKKWLEVRRTGHKSFAHKRKIGGNFYYAILDEDFSINN